MIINHKHKFIFVQNRKVAGSSVQAFFGQYCSPQDVLTTGGVDPHQNTYGFWNPLREILQLKSPKELLVDSFHRRRFYAHMPANKIKYRVSRQIWDSYYKFCIERNPWDKTISYFSMKKQRPQFKDMTFDRFLANFSSLCSDFNNYSDRQGTIIVDRVLRYEELSSDFAEVCQLLDIPFNGNIGFNINSKFRNDRRDYREVYNLDQRKIVENVYKKEIEILGYEF